MKTSWILQMLKQSFVSMREKKVFIRIFAISIVILLLPLKDLTKLGKFRILIKYFKDLFLFGGIAMIITFILTKSFLENLNRTTTNADTTSLSSSKPCNVRTTFFKWFFSFWKGYFDYDEDACNELSIRYIDKALQNILWIVLILKLIHTMETIVLPFVKGYMSKKSYPILQLVSYVTYIGTFVYYVIKSESKMDDDVKNITKLAYNSVIIYSVLTFLMLIIDKLLILIYGRSFFWSNVSDDKESNEDSDDDKESNEDSDDDKERIQLHFPVRFEDDSMVPNMKYIIYANLFVIIGVFFKKYYEIKTG